MLSLDDVVRELSKLAKTLNKLGEAILDTETKQVKIKPQVTDEPNVFYKG